MLYRIRLLAGLFFLLLLPVSVSAYSDATTVTSISQACITSFAVDYCNDVAGYADPNSITPTNTTVNGLNTTTTSDTGVGNNTGITTITGSAVNVSGGSSVTQKGSLTMTNSGVTSLSSVTAGGQNAPAMTISGQNGSTAPLTSAGFYGAYPLAPNGTGVLITGAGNAGGPDVYIASQDGKAAISVTNTGVSIISPSGTAGAPISVSSTNNYGIAGNYNNGSLNNNFGNGNATSHGAINNAIGSAASGGGTVTNSLGGGDGQSINNIGNNNILSVVGLSAGHTSQNLANGVSTTSVGAGGGVGASIIPGAGGTTSANTGIVLSGANGTFAEVNANGKLSIVTKTATQSSTSMTITNGLGNVHGLVVNEQQATLSGGQNSSSMTLNDNGATFSNPTNGAPIQVHGVQDGTSSYDAVNVRQLGRGVAMASALAGMPQVDQGKRFNVAVGAGNHMGESAVAVGGSLRLNENVLIKAGGSFAAGGSATANAGLGISF